MTLLKTTDRSFEKRFEKMRARAGDDGRSVEKKVRAILEAVRRRGDRAVREFTARFDGHRPTVLEVSARERVQARRQVGRSEWAALKLAAGRIRKFHERQAGRSWNLTNGGVRVGEVVSPVARAGLYVPGGKAAYPSTVLMNAIPASVAGVPEIVMVTPWPSGEANPYTLAAAELAGVDRIFKVGGAQAIAALAYGTESIPAVDKIVGPGNIFVATAKRLLFGRVGIDNLAGPTEIVIVADESARPEFVAADLLSQAEHDERAVMVLLTPSLRLIREVEKEVSCQQQALPRREILRRSLARNGLTILTRNLAEAIELANRIAPEHLELAVRNPARWLYFVKNAGAVFLGHQSPVAFGDYLAGPNHVLPTAGTARFSSPLGVFDFLRRSSLIEVRESALKRLGPTVLTLAEMEGLTAHAASVRLRMERVR